MHKLQLEIEMKGAAFDDDVRNHEVRRLLRRAGNEVSFIPRLEPGTWRPLLDINGNTCGHWRVVTGDD